MWQVIQKQQSQFEALRKENAEMRRRMDGATPVLEEAEDATFEIYGHVQLDAIYDFDRVDPDWKDSSRPSKIPVQDTAVFGSDGETIFSVRQSKIGLRTRNDTPMGKLKTLMEWDLYATGNDAGETEMNTTHLWIELEQWGAGQTYTNWMDVDIFPNTIDYWGPPGMVFIRKPQLRYTHYVGDAGSHWAVALEDPSSDIDAGDIRDIDPDLADNLQTKDGLPDLTLKWRSEQEWGHYQIGAIARQLEVETVSDGQGSNPNNRPTEDTFGWGLNFTSVIDVLQRDRIKFGLVYGEGIASYFNDGGSATAADSNGIKAVESLGVSLWYDHYWNATWSTSVGWGMHDQDNTNRQQADAFQTGQLGQINLLYSKGNFLTGIEAIWMQLEDESGEDNDDFRLQYSVKYAFDKGF
jgi:hypothetical protein